MSSSERIAYLKEADTYFEALDYAYERQFLDVPVTLPRASVSMRRSSWWRRALWWML